MRDNLEGKAKIFWDGLFQFYDWSDIYNSMLFSSEPCYMKQVLLRNKHLDGLEYQNLRSEIPNVTITPYIGDINKLVSNFTSTYDFINLSNICSVIGSEGRGAFMSYTFPVLSKIMKRGIALIMNQSENSECVGSFSINCTPLSF